MIQDCAAQMLNAKRDDLDQSMAVPDMNSRYLLHGYMPTDFVAAGSLRSRAREYVLSTSMWVKIRGAPLGERIRDGGANGRRAGEWEVADRKPAGGHSDPQLFDISQSASYR
jgi:hypothetical protein